MTSAPPANGFPSNITAADSNYHGLSTTGSVTSMTPEMFGYTPEFEREFSDALSIIEADSAVRPGASISAGESQTARQYLEQNIVPLLIDGLKSLNRDRPPNAAEYLAAYLLANSPQQRLTQ